MPQITATETEVIYVELLDEGTDVIRPTLAKIVGPQEYLILPTPDYDLEDEHWWRAHCCADPMRPCPC